jgi:hypothetical protein
MAGMTQPPPREREWFDRYPYSSATALSFVLAVGLWFGLVSLHQRDEPPLQPVSIPSAELLPRPKRWARSVLAADGQTLLYTGGGGAVRRANFQASNAGTDQRAGHARAIVRRLRPDAGGRLAPTSTVRLDSPVGQRPVIDAVTARRAGVRRGDGAGGDNGVGRLGWPVRPPTVRPP